MARLQGLTLEDLGLVVSCLANDSLNGSLDLLPDSRLMRRCANARLGRVVRGSGAGGRGVVSVLLEVVLVLLELGLLGQRGFSRGRTGGGVVVA